ncbi:MAG TPA: hypothetical protein VGS62_04855 [Streptosporangiaceae bacterium]|nr:hypothetical protein [Streptosporangiaceae bacterium]
MQGSSESGMNGPAAEDAVPGQDGPPAAAGDAVPGPEGPPAAGDAVPGPEAQPAAAGDAVPGSEWPPAPAGDGSPPDVIDLPGFPSPPSRSGRNKILTIAWPAAAIAILAGVLVYALIRHLNSTSGVRVIVPPPAAAGGLHQDYADEGSQFQAAVSSLRRHMGASLAGGTLTAAIYSNAPAGSPVQSASSVLVYLGFNAPSANDPASSVKLALSAIGSYLSHAATVQEGGGPGDTRFACETGSTARPVVVCAWATDRTVGFLIPQTPGAKPGELAALTKKMEQDLVRG